MLCSPITIVFAEKFGGNISSGGNEPTNTLISLAENHNFAVGDTVTISGISFDSVNLNGTFIVGQTNNIRAFQVQVDASGTEGPHVGLVGFVGQEGSQNKLKLEHFGVLVKYS